jgi:hypothetical protein
MRESIASNRPLKKLLAIVLLPGYRIFGAFGPWKPNAGAVLLCSSTRGRLRFDPRALQPEAILCAICRAFLGR